MAIEKKLARVGVSEETIEKREKKGGINEASGSENPVSKAPKIPDEIQEASAREPSIERDLQQKVLTRLEATTQDLQALINVTEWGGLEKVVTQLEQAQQALKKIHDIDDASKAKTHASTIRSIVISLREQQEPLKQRSELENINDQLEKSMSDLLTLVETLEEYSG